ncbi:recombinase family protein [Domibacillus sp. A3M-37]|uniref:recombinase family protein n=1 Tax=Domibacillus sp. A3M-37 TaxID=2962037 RepID=UPI0020B89AFA|nr:recombinase family protein [Domibacillus sp. A3M-37]MCP3764119.1 recombinase family protein [Domibacillus sp. A3M-37]
MANIGYARVSTKDQNLDLQIDALEKENCERIFTEKASSVRDRKVFNECWNYLRKGDTLVVWKLDRLGRTTKKLLELIEELENRSINLKILTLGVDTSTPAGRLFFTIMAGLAEMERDLIVERTKAGLEAARARGRLGGRPRVDQGQIDLAIKMYKSKDYTFKDIKRATGIGSSTLYRYLNAKEN